MRLLSAFNLPKKPGFGEDADPVTVERGGGEWWLAAFDGVGGAGAQTYECEQTPRTGAYLASRVAARALREWAGQAGTPNRDTAALEQELGRALRDTAAGLPRSGAALKSRMIRTLPTTAAILQVCAPQAARAGFPYDCRVLWAGDSRIFVLRPDRGLVQLTRDHLRERLDPFENLTVDSPMSNYLSADGDVRLDEAIYRFEAPFIAVAATDGCFGYVESPIVFEDMLLETLGRADDLDDWTRRLSSAIGEVTGDDASAAIGLFGWRTFDRARDAFARRRAAVRREIDGLDAAREAVEQARQTLIDRRRDVWARYRDTYEGYQSWEQE